MLSTPQLVRWSVVLVLVNAILVNSAAGSGSLAQKEILKNGLTIILECDTSSATTFLEFLIRGGQRAEPPEKQGLSFLTTRLAVDMPDTTKIQELMRLSSRFSVGSRGDYSLINIECLTSNFEPTLKILAKVIADPIFSGLRVEQIKKYMSHQSEVEKDDSLIVGHLASLAAFFGTPGYGGSIYGREESLRSLKPKDASEFYKRWFVAPNIILSISSDLEREQLLSLLNKYLSRFPSAEAPLPLPAGVKRVPEERKIFVDRETKQTLVSLAFPLSGVSSRGYALNELVKTFLGEGAGSRLWPLRSEKKLAYNVGCRLTQMLEGGLLEAYLETDKAKTTEALKALEELLRQVWESGLSEEEFEASVAVAKANFLRDGELKMIKAARLASFETLGLGFDYFDKFLVELKSLSQAEMAAYLKECLNPDKALVVVVGPGDSGAKIRQ